MKLPLISYCPKSVLKVSLISFFSSVSKIQIICIAFCVLQNFEIFTIIQNFITTTLKFFFFPKFIQPPENLLQCSLSISPQYFSYFSKVTLMVFLKFFQNFPNDNPKVSQTIG